MLKDTNLYNDHKQCYLGMEVNSGYFFEQQKHVSETEYIHVGTKLQLCYKIDRFIMFIETDGHTSKPPNRQIKTIAKFSHSTVVKMWSQIVTFIYTYTCDFNVCV